MRTDVEMLERATNWLVEAVSFANDDVLDAPTPCEAWNVAALLDHVTGGNRFTVHVVRGMTATTALAATQASFSHGADQRLAVVASAWEQFDALTADNVLTSSYHHVVGDLTGEQMLRLRIHDMCIHVWDLLMAVNPKKGLDPVYVRWAVEELAKPDSLAARHMATGFRNPTKSYELLLAFGRSRASSSGHLRRDG